MTPDFAEVTSRFCFRGDLIGVEALRSGHINDSYAAVFRVPGEEPHRYLLQRINHHVFRSPERLMQNMVNVTEHVRNKVLSAGGDPDREALTLVRTVDDGILHRTPGGEYWRAALFIEGAQTYDSARDLDQVYHAARAFGQFQRMVSDYPPQQLHETIPDFHHTPKRYEALAQAVRRDTRNRVQAVQAEIRFVEARAGDCSVLVDALEARILPQRVTHNDCKFNNVMIDDVTGEGVCVIDLDTVMPGLSLYDFGDAVRSGANSAAEDERDLSLVTIDLEIFERLVAGYLDATGENLASAEIDHLAFSAKLMTLECGMRFLTDYLDGDRYFRIHRPDHNLDRCRTQFKMVRDMEAKQSAMEAIVERHRPR
jgi:hypothetical protein